MLNSTSKVPILCKSPSYNARYTKKYKNAKNAKNAKGEKKKKSARPDSLRRREIHPFGEIHATRVVHLHLMLHREQAPAEPGIAE